MELRKCKECGKMFEPKGREQYCSDVHYRPCPMCGKPVIAKYLSDPARRCDRCKGKSAKSQPSAPVQPSMTIKPMTITQAKSLFKLSPMTISQTKKIEVNKETEPRIVKEVVTRIDTDGLDSAQPRVEPQMFMAYVRGNLFRFMRSEPLCGWDPGHDYIIDSIDRDEGCYIILGHEETQGRSSKEIGFRVTSQLSFFNYFRKVTA